MRQSTSTYEAYKQSVHKLSTYAHPAVGVSASCWSCESKTAPKRYQEGSLERSCFVFVVITSIEYVASIVLVTSLIRVELFEHSVTVSVIIAPFWKCAPMFRPYVFLEFVSLPSIMSRMIWSANFKLSFSLLHFFILQKISIQFGCTDGYIIYPLVLKYIVVVTVSSSVRWCPFLALPICFWKWFCIRFRHRFFFYISNRQGVITHTLRVRAF